VSGYKFGSFPGSIESILYMPIPFTAAFANSATSERLFVANEICGIHVALVLAKFLVRGQKFGPMVVSVLFWA
jgi:hypothetical protein